MGAQDEIQQIRDEILEWVGQNPAEHAIDSVVYQHPSADACACPNCTHKSEASLRPVIELGYIVDARVQGYDGVFVDQFTPILQVAWCDLCESVFVKSRHFSDVLPVTWQDLGRITATGDVPSVFRMVMFDGRNYKDRQITCIKDDTVCRVANQIAQGSIANEQSYFGALIERISTRIAASVEGWMYEAVENVSTEAIDASLASFAARIKRAAWNRLFCLIGVQSFLWASFIAITMFLSEQVSGWRATTAFLIALVCAFVMSGASAYWQLSILVTRDAPMATDESTAELQQLLAAMRSDEDSEDEDTHE